MPVTHQTATTCFVEVDGAQFAYRRWGNTASGLPPVVFFQHFRGGMDNWDPLLTDGLAQGREVILYNYGSSGFSVGNPCQELAG